MPVGVVAALTMLGTIGLAAPASAAGSGTAPAPAVSSLAGSPTAESAQSAQSAPSAAAKKRHKVTVPSKYVYDPKLGSLHDYCTDAPDEFPAPFAKNADFRGPCARHDLCYGSSTKKNTCDKALKKNLYANCNYYYGPKNPLRYACKTTALGYWAIVIVDTHKP